MRIAALLVLAGTCLAQERWLESLENDEYRSRPCASWSSWGPRRCRVWSLWRTAKSGGRTVARTYRIRVAAKQALHKIRGEE